jgi:AcrR family transcriptional regulator
LTAQEKPPRRAKRRSTEEVIDRIISAASEEFELYGYAGATTAAIARKAGVAEPLIFSNFGSKSNLFHASIFRPLNKHLEDFRATHWAHTAKTEKVRRELTRKYILELEQFIEKHSRKFISLFFEQTYYNTDNGLHNIEGIQDYLSYAASIQTTGRDGEPKIDPRIIARLSFATVFSSVIFREWIFPNDVASKDEVLSSLPDFILDGLNANARGK